MSSLSSQANSPCVKRDENGLQYIAESVPIQENYFHCHAERNLSAAAIIISILLLICGDYLNSPGIDEPSYLIAGIAHWKLARFDICAVSPPLARLIAAIPVILSRPKYDWSDYTSAPGDRPELYVGKTFIELNGVQSFWFFTLARWMLIPFSILGSVICYRWAKQLYGNWAGLIATLLWCYCPNILAHSQQVNPDMTMTALAVTAMYLFWRWLRQPTLVRATVAGVVLGVCQLAKSNVLVFGPLWIILWLLDRRLERQTRIPFRFETLQIFWMGVMALYVLNLGYLFHGTLLPLRDYVFVSQAFMEPGNLPGQIGNRFRESWIGGIPLPFPQDYIKGIDLLLRDFENTLGNTKTYFRGQLYDHGFWWFYFYVLAIKVPLGTWGLGFLAIGSRFWRPARLVQWRDEVVLLAPAASLFVLASSQTGFSHHLRYVLGIFPFVFIWISRVVTLLSPVRDGKLHCDEFAGAPKFARKNRLPSVAPQFIFAGLIAILLTWSVSSSLSIHPHGLSYFNELVGGPKGGQYHVLESNLDWGQDLMYLKYWIDAHPEATPLAVAYFGPVAAEIAGIKAPKPPEGKSAGLHSEIGPQPGWYAVSVAAVWGSSFWDQGDYKYFQYFEPVDCVGYSIYIYHLTADDVDRVRQRLRVP